MSPKKSSRRSSPPPVDALRCVRSPEGRLVADFHGKLPCARPLWLGTRPDVLKRAVAHDLASTWFGLPTIADDQFISQVKTGAERAAFEILPMLHKSGACVLGLEAVLQALDAGGLRLVIIATDAGTSDMRKLSGPLGQGIGCFRFGSKAQLGRAFGRRAQVFVGVMQGELCEKLAFYLHCQRAHSDHSS